MPTSSTSAPPLRVSPLTTEQSRQRLTAAILAGAAGGPNSLSTPRELHYLEQFRRGRLTIDEIVYYLEATASH